MFGSAYSVLRCFVIGFVVGDWIGLPQYAGRVASLEREGTWFEVLAGILPFIAALLLGFGKGSLDSAGNGLTRPLSYTAETKAEKWTTPVVQYLIYFLTSLAGIAAFLFFFLLVEFVFFKLGIFLP
ncbi:MAG: hypothetical protein WA855_14220 [Candidatus Acidiferrales bacterium]